jgi:hypothetical protein
MGRKRQLVSDADVDGTILRQHPIVQAPYETTADTWTAIDGLGGAVRTADAPASPPLESS